MKLVFRHYGDKDLISLENIRQIPVLDGIVSALYNFKVGEIWKLEDILRLKAKINEHNLSFEVVESVPVHEDIKLHKGNYDYYINNYIETLKNLSKCGVKVVCYNFMPIFDWLRSDLKFKLDDKSYTLKYSHQEVLDLNPRNSTLSLPGWDESYKKEELSKLFDLYKDINEDILWNNLIYFLSKIIPVCEAINIKMAIHPDDPPWNIFGLPRIIKSELSYQKLIKEIPSIHNGITLCTGSLGANKGVDIVKIIEKYNKYIHFVHARNIKRFSNNDFYETAHPSNCGDIDMYQIIKSLIDNNFEGYLRPDHGRQIWGETGQPGYGLYDRALGVMYLSGLIEAINKNKGK